MHKPWWIFFALLSALTAGCSDSDPVEEPSSLAPGLGIPQGPAEKAYCPYLPQQAQFSNQRTVFIVGSAGYYFRKNAPGESGTLSTTTRPIRGAEVSVVDGASGKVVQCAETDSNGQFGFRLPADSRTYRLVVASRARNSLLEASVLAKPDSNSAYEVSATFTADRDQELAELEAHADAAKDPAISAGAFNILDDIYRANQWLREQTAACNDPASPHFVSVSCEPFTMAPKATVYWRAGFNPGEYYSFGQSAPALSFYLPGQRILMILGGNNGDVDHSDNDQFDDSVIIHEYGHFIEDVYAKTNSPGGSHDGNSIIDPRLAWGEGWANFFQAAVTGLPYYRDTVGTADGNFGVYFTEDISTRDPLQAKWNVSDVPRTSGEGIFREFAVSRALWSIIAPHPISAEISREPGLQGGLKVPFSELWFLFTDSSLGFRSNNLHFRHMGLWLANQISLSRNDISAVRTVEYMDPWQERYGIPLRYGSCSQSGQIQADTTAFDNGSFATSNLAVNNRFYYLNHPGGALDVQLNWQATGRATDLDLYLYREDHRYGDSTTMAAVSNANLLCAQNCSKRLQVSSLAPGHYLLNIMVYTHDTLGSPANYLLSVNGGKVCL